jgi:hypothetical protein
MTISLGRILNFRSFLYLWLPLLAAFSTFVPAVQDVPLDTKVEQKIKPARLTPVGRGCIKKPKN